jgi:hypothetical protein
VSREEKIVKKKVVEKKAVEKKITNEKTVKKIVEEINMDL